ncbi:MAG: hypothetical protein ACLSGS_00005, partial [Adlercreutzia sp.]
ESVNVIVAREGAYDPRARIHAEDEAERIDADVLALVERATAGRYETVGRGDAGKVAEMAVEHGLAERTGDDELRRALQGAGAGRQGGGPGEGAPGGQLGLEGWAKDPVAVAMRDWRLQHAPETLEGKSEEQSAGRWLVHLLAESRRTAAAQAWMRSPQSSQAKDAQQKAALMNAAAAAENEAMISEIPDIAISL